MYKTVKMMKVWNKFSFSIEYKMLDEDPALQILELSRIQ